MDGHWYTFDDVIETDANGYCRISRERIPTCGFSQVKPGDIIGVTHTWDKTEKDNYSEGILFVKVLSVKKPKVGRLFMRDYPGNVIVQLPNGDTTELLRWDPRSWPSGICYFPSRAIYDYFVDNCEIDGMYVDLRRIIIYTGHEAALQADMQAEKLRRDKVRKARVAKHREEEEARKAKEATLAEEAKRNVEAKKNMHNLFDSMVDLETKEFACPKCGALCAIPVRGKAVVVHCRCNHDFEIFC